MSIVLNKIIIPINLLIALKQTVSWTCTCSCFQSLSEAKQGDHSYQRWGHSGLFLAEIALQQSHHHWTSIARPHGMHAGCGRHCVSQYAPVEIWRIELLIEHSGRWFENLPRHNCPTHWQFPIYSASTTNVHHGFWFGALQAVKYTINP